MSEKRFPGWLASIGLLTSMAGAEMARSYRGEFHEFVRGYVHDTTLPFGIYLFNRFLGERLNTHFKHRAVSAAFAFGGCAAAEFAQKLGLYPGTFDSYDFVAYAVGTSLAFATDYFVTRKKPRGLENVLQ